MKCVMIVDESLQNGLVANTTAVLGISLANKVENLVGPRVADLDGRVHEGIVNIPVPILSTDRIALKNMYDTLMDNASTDIEIIGFSSIAQKCLDYSDYENRLNHTRREDMGIIGICIYGPKKHVNKLTGHLKMLR